MTSNVRENIVERLVVDLVGPSEVDEVLTSRPTDLYLTGILWPKDARFDQSEDDDSQFDVDESQLVNAVQTLGQQRPCSMGLSCAFSEFSKSARVTIEFAYYQPEFQDSKNLWRRIFIEKDLVVDLTQTGGEFIPIEVADKGELQLQLHIRKIKTKVGLLATFTLINNSSIEASSDRSHIESITLFQTRLEVSSTNDSELIPRPHRKPGSDLDEQSASLLYSKVKEFATGHQCSAAWNESEGKVFTCWLPQATVPAFSDRGSKEFDELNLRNLLSADTLSTETQEVVLRNLQTLVDCYNVWIGNRELEANLLSQDYQVIARRHLDSCKSVSSRMQNGVDALADSPELFTAFALANRAMNLQHSWKTDVNGIPLPKLTWRPFQIGFILLALESVTNPTSPERDVLDLLWFPTGGGKTEAYLALIAIASWYRRLCNSGAEAGGCVSIMRYTLRLLTTQQFERAAALILASEVVRREMPNSQKQNFRIMPEFSIGLWVGEGSTPNTFNAALEAKSSPTGSSPEQLRSCYVCKENLSWEYNHELKSVYPTCINLDCVLGLEFGAWPVFTIDEDLARRHPTLLIGTVDKFAQLPFKKEISDLFQFKTRKSPDLIIQDELHLISGPLGTMVGLYESALDWLLVKDGSRPKIIGSTATIRRAQEQVRALFDRESCQFPPPGLDANDSGFATVDREKPGRLYVGVSTAGRSAKFTLQATAGSLMQSGGPTSGLSDSDRDGYSTLLFYFNSLRELGGAIVQVLDDVPDSIDIFAKNRLETGRTIFNQKELTSRVSQDEITGILSELTLSCSADAHVDAVLATNMVSVGVDVPRLGLMLVNGQPKTRSEYIQSTSRVGRSINPGLVVSLLNAAKPRDRSHFETFSSWHSTIYRDVEATSVTPFAPRARDRALRTVLVSMVRHGIAGMLDKPKRPSVIDASALDAVLAEILRRVKSISPGEIDAVEDELNLALNDWENRSPVHYKYEKRVNESLLQNAETNARRIASFRTPYSAWATMNSMRSVEPSTPFRMAEILRTQQGKTNGASAMGNDESRVVPNWRNNRVAE